MPGASPSSDAKSDAPGIGGEGIRGDVKGDAEATGLMLWRYGGELNLTASGNRPRGLPPPPARWWFSGEKWRSQVTATPGIGGGAKDDTPGYRHRGNTGDAKGDAPGIGGYAIGIRRAARASARITEVSAALARAAEGSAQSSRDGFITT
jgi:hypothetical protein